MSCYTRSVLDGRRSSLASSPSYFTVSLPLADCTRLVSSKFRLTKEKTPPAPQTFIVTPRSPCGWSGRSGAVCSSHPLCCRRDTHWALFRLKQFPSTFLWRGFSDNSYSRSPVSFSTPRPLPQFFLWRFSRSLYSDFMLPSGPRNPNTLLGSLPRTVTSTPRVRTLTLPTLPAPVSRPEASRLKIHGWTQDRRVPRTSRRIESHISGTSEETYHRISLLSRMRFTSLREDWWELLKCQRDNMCYLKILVTHHYYFHFF